MSENDTLEMWVVYDGPLDYPESFVARRWDIQAGKVIATDQVMLAPTLDILRQHLPFGLINIGRRKGDDAKIVEVWI